MNVVRWDYGLWQAVLEQSSDTALNIPNIPAASVHHYGPSLPLRIPLTRIRTPLLFSLRPHRWHVNKMNKNRKDKKGLSNFEDTYSHIYIRGPGSSVGITTELRAWRSGIESRWGRDFPPVQTGPGTHPTSCKMGTESLTAVKCGRGVLLATHPLLVPLSWKSRAVPLPTLWATPGL